MRSWVKGGIIGAIFGIFGILLIIPLLYLTPLGYSDLKYLFFPAIPLIEFLQNLGILAPHIARNYIVSFSINAIIWTILGMLIGFIIQKIR